MTAKTMKTKLKRITGIDVPITQKQILALLNDFLTSPSQSVHTVASASPFLVGISDISVLM